MKWYNVHVCLYYLKYGDRMRHTIQQWSEQPASTMPLHIWYTMLTCWRCKLWSLLMKLLMKCMHSDIRALINSLISSYVSKIITPRFVSNSVMTLSRASSTSVIDFMLTQSDGGPVMSIYSNQPCFTLISIHVSINLSAGGNNHQNLENNFFQCYIFSHYREIH